jgi:maleylacetate reductase
MISGTHRNSAQEQVIYGRPAAEAVAALADSYGAQRLLLVTTASLDRPTGRVAAFREELGSRCVGTFSRIRAHSPREDVIACAAFARDKDADLLVALGGGSVIDAVKVVQLCLWADVRSPEALGELRGSGAASLKPAIRTIALPTTLSAAEFTPFAGVTDTERRAKEGYFHPQLAPRAVVLDPRLTLETPAELWLSTGIKAVDHAVEQLCNLERAPFSDALAEGGLKHLARGLPDSKKNPEDLDARLECQFGMWLAIAGASTGRGIGASHAIGHTLGGTFGIPHGLTSCVILPAVLAWNASANAGRQALVSRLLGRPDVYASRAVKDLVKSLGLPTSLAGVGIERDKYRAIAEATMHDRGVQSNPRPIRGPDDIMEILELTARPPAEH